MGSITKSSPKTKMRSGGRTNLLTNPELAGGVGGAPGTAPTGWTFGAGTGNSAEDGTAADGVSKIISQSATAQRPFFQQARTDLVVGDVVTTTLVVESLVSGTPTFLDTLSRTGTATGTSVFYINDVAGASSRAIATGDRLMTVFTCTVAGTNSMRCGVGVNGSATAAVKFSQPKYFLGTS